MASFNIELNSKPVRDTNEYSLLLRITVNRKHARVKLNYAIQRNVNFSSIILHCMKLIVNYGILKTIFVTLREKRISAKILSPLRVPYILKTTKDRNLKERLI